MGKTAAWILVGAFSGAAVMWFVDSGARGPTTDTGEFVSIFGDAGRRDIDSDAAGAAAQSTTETASLERLARDDPAAALEQALQIDDAVQQRLAVERVATAWAARDPLAALAQESRLPARLRMPFRAAVDSEWARLDASGYLAFVEANPAFLEELIGKNHYQQEPVLAGSGGIRWLLASDPLAVSSLADKLSSRLGATLESLALRAYAELDPAGAIALADRLPRGSQRDEMLAAVAQGFALVDPEGAWNWARNLSPAPTSVIGDALLGIAQTDIGRALDLGLQIQVAMDAVGTGSFYPPVNELVLKAAEDSVTAKVTADALIASPAVRRNLLLDRLLQYWAERDPEAALNWVRANAASLDEDAIASPAYGISTRDPALAARFTDQVPPAMRATWIDRVAQGYASADGAAALEWISRYEGQPGYDVGLRRILTSYASDDPVAAARVLETADPEIQLGAIGPVADFWAQRDAPAAANWARNLDDATLRATALPEAVGRWMTQSSQAAEDWTLALPPGNDRDQALYTLLRGRSYSSEARETYSRNPTAVLVGQISDAEMRRTVGAWFEGDTLRD